MLSEAERRKLEELDRLMISEDPVLAQACREMHLPSRLRPKSPVLIALFAVMAVLSLIGAGLAAEPALVALSVLLAVVAARLYWLRPRN